MITPKKRPSNNPLGRPKVRDYKQFRLGLRVRQSTRAFLEAIAKDFGVSQSDAVEVLAGYSYRDRKEFKAFAAVYFKRGLEYALSVDGRVEITRILEGGIAYQPKTLPRTKF